MGEANVSEAEKTQRFVEDDYIRSDEEKNLLSNLIADFRRVQIERDRQYPYFDGFTLVEKINEGTNAFVTNFDIRDGIEDWQSIANQPFTRNKVMAVLGKMVQYIPKEEFVAVGDEDTIRANILQDLYDYVARMDDEDELRLYALLEAIIKPACVGYEGYYEKERTIRDVRKYDGAEGLTFTERKITERKIYGAIVPLEDFFPSSVYVRKIKDMPYCFWRSFVPYDQFMKDFGHYAKSQYVKPHSNRILPTGDLPYYIQFVAPNLQHGMVEVLRYYNQEVDEFVVIANGCWLNPLQQNGKDITMPLPFIHKTLPFWNFVFEPVGDFFYGKSLSDKLQVLQKIMNVLHNMMIDQSLLSIFSPILTDGIDEIDDDILRPGRRIAVSNPQGYKQLEISTPGGFHEFILNYTKNVLEESSIDSVSQGRAGTGDRVTATEIQQAAAGVEAMLGLPNSFFKWGLRQKVRIRAKNVLQFATKPFVEGVEGEGGYDKFTKAFTTIKVDNTTLTTGKRGVKLLEIYADKGDMPTKAEQTARAVVMGKRLNKNVERIAIPADYIRDFEFDIKFVSVFTPENNKAISKALTLEKAKVYTSLFPDLIDREELAASVAEEYGDNPAKIFKAASKPTPPQNPLAAVNGANPSQNGMVEQMLNSSLANNGGNMMS